MLGHAHARSFEKVVQSFGRPAAKRDGQKNVACAGIQLPAPERVHVHAHLLVARARELERSGDSPETSVRLGDRAVTFVEPRERGEKPIVDSRCRVDHSLRIAGEA